MPTPRHVARELVLAVLACVRDCVDRGPGFESAVGLVETHLEVAFDAGVTEGVRVMIPSSSDRPCGASVVEEAA